MTPANLRLFFFCPVPENQKPLSELISFEENLLFSWMTFSTSRYLKQLAWLILISLIGSFGIIFPLFSFSFSFSLLSLSLVPALFVLWLLFLLAFFRLIEIQSQLNCSRLPYEEGSWYEGQIWEKPFSFLKNEKLVRSQIVDPILQRISLTFSFFFCFLTLDLFFLLS